MLIGICGRTCCGKDTIVQSIASVNRRVLHINCDLFFKSKTACTYKGHTNWEDVNSLRIEHLTKVIQAFKEHRGITLQDRSPWWGSYDCEILKEDLINRDVIIFQGFLLFALKEIADQFDHKIFIDINNVELARRRIKREPHIDRNILFNVIMPASYRYEKIQKTSADITIESNSVSPHHITDKVVNYINGKIQNGKSLHNPFNHEKWKVYPGDLLCDQEWHPIDFRDLKAYARNCEQWMNEGNIVEGNTFQYRKNHRTGGFEVRLGKELDPLNNYKGVYRHIFRYTHEYTMPKKPIT